MTRKYTVWRSMVHAGVPLAIGSIADMAGILPGALWCTLVSLRKDGSVTQAGNGKRSRWSAVPSVCPTDGRGKSAGSKANYWQNRNKPWNKDGVVLNRKSPRPAPEAPSQMLWQVWGPPAYPPVADIHPIGLNISREGAPEDDAQEAA